MKMYVLVVISILFSSVSMANNYGIELSTEEKVEALTNYFIKKDLKVKKISLPPKPKKLPLPKPNKITKSKYEKLQVFQKRVQTEKENYAKRIQSIEKKNIQSLKEYDSDVEKIIKSHEHKNKLIDKKIKQQSKEKAYAVVYGNPYIVKKSLNYDAESEVFNAELKSMKGDFLENIVIKVPSNEAERFEKNIKRMKIKVVFEIKDNSKKIKYVSIKSSKNTYIGKLK